MMRSISQIACERGVGFVISYSPIFPESTDALFFPETQTLITSLEVAPCGSAAIEKNISCGKFCDNSALSSFKNRLKGIEKLISEIFSEAQKELGEAKKIHDEIESIYIPAMNFSDLDEFTFDFINKIFKE